MRIVPAAVIFLCLLAPSPPLRGQETGDFIKLGQEKFNDICAACHRTNGEGLPDKFPALKGNAFVTGDPAPVVGTVLNGRQGRLGLMPAWKDTFNDREVAAIVSYIRQAWGNQAPDVAPDLVAKIRGK
jgi:mono/diheme cytochrome c family protein